MIVWIILALVVIYLIITYNSLVSIKKNVAKAWANIDVLLNSAMTSCQSSLTPVKPT